MHQPLHKPKTFALLLAAVTLLALGLRLYRLDAESLYMDEIVTVETFHRDPLGVVLGAAIVGQPPLDNFVGAFVYRLGLGQSDGWVRFPAAVFGSASIVFLGVWVRRLAGDIAGVTAALLLAVCPLHAYISQEVRPYSLMFFLALACGLCYVRARERNNAASWILFSCVSFAMLMTRWTDPHFIILGIGLHALVSRLRAAQADCDLRKTESSIFRRAVLATTAAYACYAPFFCVVLHYHHSTSIRSPSNDWAGRFSSLLYEAFAALFAGYSTRTVFVALPGSRWLVLFGALLTVAGLALAIMRLRQAHSASSAFWWIFVPFPFVYALVYALLGDAIPKPQYLLVTAIPVFAFIAIGLDTLCQSVRIKPAKQLIFLVTLLVVAVPMAQRSWAALSHTDKRDWRGAMGFLKEHAAPGDVAVCMGSDTMPPAFRPKAYGKDRYGPEYLRFIPISTDTPLDAFTGAEWRSQSNTVWMLVYTDRMYTGTDHVVPPRPSPDIKSLRSFNGLFLAELGKSKPAIERLMGTIGEWYAVLPAEASIPAPALLRWRHALSCGDALGAAESIEAARRQCASKAELAALEEIVGNSEAVAKR